MEEKITNILIATAKGAVSALPGGGLLAEYIGLAQSAIADKRMNAWKRQVEQTLEKIPKSMSELAENEEFYSCVQMATIGAMQAYQQEKRELFANALFHSAVDVDLFVDKKLYYISLLSEYTLSHIELLKYFSENNYNEEDNVEKRGMVTVTKFGGTEYPMTGILEAFPQFKEDTSFVKHLTERLISDSLVSLIDFSTPVSRERARAKRITRHGEEFLKFIME